MMAASFSGGTVWGSRHGNAGRPDVAGERAPAIGFMIYDVSVRADIAPTSAFRLQLEFRIADNAHLRQVQTFELRSRSDALSDEPVDQQVEHKAQRKHEPDERNDSDELRHQLPAVVAIEDSCDRARYA